MKSLEDLFLKNLSYCAVVKHRNPSESIFCDISATNLGLIQEEIGSILKSNDGKRLIYFFFVDKQTKENLKKVFDNFTFIDFIGYFDSCQKCVLEDNLSLSHILQFINFFHLIGSLRIIKGIDTKQSQINNILIEIIKSHEFPFLIKYSASQIYVCRDLGNSELYYNDDLQNFYKELLKSINEDGAFTKFIALYSMYYNSFDVKASVVKELKDQIVKGSNIDFNALHTYLPQIHAILLRSDKNKFRRDINKNRILEKLYSFDCTRSMVTPKVKTKNRQK